jgi:acetyltransferase-like isoleucine patch superfamily enzyme
MAPRWRSALGAVRRRATTARDDWYATRNLTRSMRAMEPPAPSRFAAFGEGSWMVPPARVEGAEHIEFGTGVIIHEHSWLVARPIAGRPPPRLRLGDGTCINRFANIVCTASVEFGKEVIVADRIYVSDVEYPLARLDARLPADVEPRPVVIGDGVFLGTGAIIKPGVTIGQYAYVSAGSIVAEDVAEWTVVAGAPARAVRRITEAPD